MWQHSPSRGRLARVAEILGDDSLARHHPRTSTGTAFPALNSTEKKWSSTRPCSGAGNCPGAGRWQFGDSQAVRRPLTAIRIAGLAHEAGVPAGVFQVLPGDGEVGKLLSLHLDVDCLAFTGSTGVGKRIMGYAAESNLKRVWLELGGKSPNIVLGGLPGRGGRRPCGRWRDFLQPG